MTKYTPTANNEAQAEAAPELPTELTEKRSDYSATTVHDGPFLEEGTWKFRCVQVLIYTGHILVQMFVLFGWTVWPPFSVCLAVTGITWELAKGCPCDAIEKFYVGVPLFKSAYEGSSGSKSRLVLWIITLASMIVSVTS